MTINYSSVLSDYLSTVGTHDSNTYIWHTGIEQFPNQYGHCDNKTEPEIRLAWTDKDSRFYSDSKEIKGDKKMKEDFKKNKIKTTGVNIYIKYDSRPLMPDIHKVKAGNFEPGSKDLPYVIVYFADGTKTKAVISKNDIGSVETGVSICLFKKLLGENGHAIYNRLIDYAMDVYNGTDERSKYIAECKANIEKERTAIEKRRKKREKRERERQIEVQKEAYLRAMREFAEGHSDKLEED